MAGDERDIRPGGTSSESGQVGPAESGEPLEVAFILGNSDFYRHFLERFLDSIAERIHLPWWAVHLALYLATILAFVSLVDIPRLYPRAGFASFGLEQCGEFLFTTFLLWHLRKSRSIAIVAAARVSNAKGRMIWLRKYLAPASWGWIVKWGEVRWRVPVWFVTAVILACYWGGQLVYYRGGPLSISHAHTYWDSSYPYPQLLYLYPTIAKAAMITTAVAHFWWLSGLTAIVGGRWPSTLSGRQKRLLYLECSRTATQFTIAVSLTAMLWVFARALAYGFGLWAYLYSLALLMLVAGQVTIFGNFQPSEWIRLHFFRELIASEFLIDWPDTMAGRLTGLSLVWGLILGLGPLAKVVAALA
jgi:hypothetical protein